MHKVMQHVHIFPSSLPVSLLLFLTKDIELQTMLTEQERKNGRWIITKNMPRARMSDIWELPFRCFPFGWSSDPLFTPLSQALPHIFKRQLSRCYLNGDWPDLWAGSRLTLSQASVLASLEMRLGLRFAPGKKTLLFHARNGHGEFLQCCLFFC